MNIKIYDPSDFDTDEIGPFIYRVKQTELDNRGITPDEFNKRLFNEWTPSGYVLAHSGGEIIGCILLYRLDNSDLIEINPGSLLGSHPIVSPNYDKETVGAELVQGAKKWVLQSGFNAVYIDIPWDPTAQQESYDGYRHRYGELGFEVIQQVQQMNCPLPAEIPRMSPPPDIELDQIRVADEDELYQCHYLAYMNSEVGYFYQMDDGERRGDFERIFSPNTRRHPASLVLTRDDRIIGYCLLFSEGGFSELMSLAVHPEYRRRGLSKLLLVECMQRAAQGGHKTMHLIVDVHNQAAVNLYRQCGFKEIGGNMTFKWKA
jgi:ribosomal protein S18 acetylase RimI-like enzyme